MGLFFKQLISNNNVNSMDTNVARRAVVGEALSYKPEGGGFNSLQGHSMFSVYVILPAALWPLK
jgi:hypothetical protein